MFLMHFVTDAFHAGKNAACSFFDCTKTPYSGVNYVFGIHFNFMSVCF